MPSPRVRDLADQIKEIVAAMLERRVKDPRLGFVTSPTSGSPGTAGRRPSSTRSWR